jgi:hypothetical protein
MRCLPVAGGLVDHVPAGAGIRERQQPASGSRLLQIAKALAVDVNMLCGFPDPGSRSTTPQRA